MQQEVEEEVEEFEAIEKLEQLGVNRGSHKCCCWRIRLQCRLYVN